jgi:hypothetical protein
MAFARLADLDLALPTDRTRDWTPLLVNRALRVVQPARAAAARQVEQGNVLLGHSFTVVRQHESYAAAGIYLDNLPLLVGRAFGVFTADRGLGGPLIEYRHAAVTQLRAQPHSGVLTTVNFTVVGSPLPAV